MNLTQITRHKNLFNPKLKTSSSEMMSIVTESGSQEKFSFGEIKYRDDKTKLIEEIRLLNDQNKILKNRIRDSIREIKEREKDVQSWRSGKFFNFQKHIRIKSTDQSIV